MSDRLRVGFVGCGLIARSHARNLTRLAGVAAVHDLDRARADAFALDLTGSTDNVAGSAAEVIDGCDAVYICTWTAAHPEVVTRAAAAGRAVFCEKPLAVDLATAEEMVRAVTDAGVVNQVGLVLRASPAFRWLHHRLRQPDVGPVMNVVFRDDQYLPTQGMYRSTWRADRTRAGAGALLEHSIHDLDLLTWLLGPIRSVSAITANLHGLVGIEDQATVMLAAASGAQACLVSVWHDVLSRPSQRRLEVFCRDAVVTLSGDWSGPVEVDRSSGREGPYEGAVLARAATAADGLHLDPDAAFVDAVRHGRPAHPGFATALEAHRLVDAAYRSADLAGQPVEPPV